MGSVERFGGDGPEDNVGGCGLVKFSGGGEGPTEGEGSWRESSELMLELGGEAGELGSGDVGGPKSMELGS